jgi:hypothetical protein
LEKIPRIRGGAMPVFQCPECDLRFLFASELDQHIADEHPDFKSEPKSVEDSLLAASHKRRRAPEYHPEGG